MDLDRIIKREDEIVSLSWKALVERKKNRATSIEIRKRHRREMWEELGVDYVADTVLGDICIGMALLSPDNVNIFERELDRRCREEESHNEKTE